MVRAIRQPVQVQIQVYIVTVRRGSRQYLFTFLKSTNAIKCLLQEKIGISIISFAIIKCQVNSDNLIISIS